MSSDATAQAFWVTSPGRGEIREEALPAPGSGELQIRTRYSAVSRGTEALVFTGRIPPSEFERMRAPFQQGQFPAPVKYGYVNVGVVEAGPSHWLGKDVFTLFPHQTRFNISSAAVVPLPRELPAQRAVLAANLETAINALWDAQLEPATRLTVIGAGALGCLCAWLARSQYEADVELVDINPERAAVAAQIGADFATPADARADAPLVIHTSATEAGLQSALSLAGFEATILELSWFGNARPRVPLGEAFHSRRLTLRASQVGHVAAPMRGHHSRTSRLQMALRLLRDPALEVLIDSESNFSELPDVMAALADGSRNAICHRVHYD